MAGPGGDSDWFTGIAAMEVEHSAVSLIGSIDALSHFTRPASSGKGPFS